MDTKRVQEGGFLTQYKALLIRNLLIKKRKKRHTITEFAVPLFLILMLAVVRMSVPTTIYEPITYEHDGRSLQLDSNLISGNMLVTPNSSMVSKIMAELARITNITPLSVKYFDTEEELVSFYRSNSNVSVALVFSNKNPVEISSYTIRTNPALGYLVRPTTLMTPGSNCRKNTSDIDCQPNSYFSSGFLSLQSAIDQSIMNLKKNERLPRIYIYVQSFPLNSYISEGSAVLRVIVPFYMVFAWAQFIVYMMVLIVEEKEKKIKEGMKMMGLRVSLYWLSWVTIYFAYVVVLAIICIIVLPLAKVFQNANLFLLFILFVLYGLSSIIFALLLTPFFSKAKMAGIVALLVLISLSLLFFLQVYLGDTISPTAFWFLALLSPCAFTLALDKAILFDYSKGGLGFNNIWDGVGLPFAGCLIMISIDIVLYLMLALYFDKVIPTEYGTQQPPWFIFRKSTWIRKKEKTEKVNAFSNHDDDVANNNNVEPFPSEWKGREAVRIRNLHKVYKSRGKEEVHAVNGLSMDIYEGQITAILGHNGAGKTTVFNILTGLTSPTEGNAVIFNYSISDQNDLAAIRRLTGVCPQHDILFLTLTPKEHLTFYGRIKGVDKTLIKSKVTEMLQEIDLVDKADTQADHLSGGQKRKLSIGIALIGDPKIIFLDEPTAGLDALSRRHLWTLLKKKKENKVILLTTHFMDEADILADRKAIISNGKLRCYGTSLFLKKRFGLGYHLTVIISDTPKASKLVENQVKNIIPNAKLVRHSGKELSFILPSSSSSLFSQLFTSLDLSIADAGATQEVESYGISMTTLEEVFLVLSDEKEDEVNHESINNLKTPSPLHSSKKNKEKEFRVKDLVVEKSQRRIFKALIKLRFTNARRDIASMLMLILFPLVFFCFILYFAREKKFESATNDNRISLNTDIYSSTAVNGVLLYNGTNDNLAAFESVLNEFNLVPTLYNGSYLSIYENQPHFSSFDLFNFDNRLVNLTLRYNTSFAHSLPILINVISNSVMRSFINGTSLITTSAQQLPQLDDATKFDIGAYSPLMIGFVFIVIPAVLVIDIVYDREINGQSILRLNGVDFNMYFISFFFVIGIIYLISYVGLLITVKAFNVPSLALSPAYGCLAILYLIYMPSALLFSSCASYIFHKKETALKFYLAFVFLIGMVSFVIMVICDIIKGSDISLPIHIVFTICISYYIPFAVIYYIIKVYSSHSLAGSSAELTFSDYMTTEIVFMIVVCIVDIFVYYVLLRIIYTFKLGGDIREALWMKKTKTVDSLDHNEDSLTLLHADDDVIAERKRIISMMMSEARTTSPAIVYNLSKTYVKKRKGLRKIFSKSEKQDNREMTAVKSLSFDVRPGEVFGLLGPNGAGKTSTIRIMIAEEPPSKGKVMICGYNITSSLSSAYSCLKYCPQHDCLWKNITVDEHIECFATINGIRHDQVESLVNFYLEGFEIMDHRKKKSKNCSGGTKRKLSYILSMIGLPKIVLMDEPSTGMDPQSKRFLWNSILSSFKGDRCALLTTHSMEEADALCSRIGILVKGELRCIGPVQHLKNKYGSGYNLEIKLRKKAIINAHSPKKKKKKNLQKHLKALIKSHFPNCHVDEEFEERIVFKIPQSDITSLAEVFDMLETLKKDKLVEEYALGQTTLEQVFLRFARIQEEEDNINLSQNK